MTTCKQQFTTLLIRRRFQLTLWLSALFGLLAVSSCQPARPVALTVQLVWQGQPITCQTALDIHGQHFSLQQLQFYLADFRQQQPLTLVPNHHRSADVALLGTDCQSPGVWELQFQQPLHSGPLSFQLGVPFALNHQNPLQADLPLQQADMHWAWQSGYKFFRLDLQGQQDSWSFHLGSTGCHSASVVRPATAPCQAPNRVLIELPYQGETRLTVDLAPLFATVQPNRSNSCMSDPTSLSCQQLLPILLAAPDQQVIWRLQP